MKFLIQVLSVILVISSINIKLFAQATTNDLQLNTITTALPFMSITPDSRSGAMGDVGVALSPTSSSIYWNTSMLNFGKKRSELSISYTPWLRQLTNDIHLSYVSGYTKMGKRHAVGGAMRYFSLGEITFTDQQANEIRTDRPNEFEFTGGYAFKLSERMSIGVNGKFAYSNLTGGLIVEGAQTKAAIAGAADVSFSYVKEDANIGNTKGDLSFGATINNLGNKVRYSETADEDFLPMNLKLGSAYNIKIDQYNNFTLAFDINKLLVPTPPLTPNTINYTDIPQGVIIGKSDQVGIVNGMLQSFYDAPGKPVRDENGDLVENADGTYEIEKNSRLKEELREINLCFGTEYWYNNTFAVRAGYFYEHYTKGARQYLNVGLGLKYNVISIDMSYLFAVKKNNPLANTLRFTLRFDIGSNQSSTTETPQ